MIAITEQIRQDLINSFRQILMEADTECGNEILCTMIAESCADAAMKYIDSLDARVDTLRYEVQELNDYVENLTTELEELESMNKRYLDTINDRDE